MRNMRRALPLLLLAASAAVSLSARAADVLFAQVASHTNPASAANAKGMSTGIRVYFEKVNAGGGVNGHQLKLTTLDDDLQGPKMLALTQEVIDARSAIGLLGFLNSAGLAEIAKQDLLGKSGMALIAPLQGDKHVVGARNIFPLRSGYADEIAALLKEAKAWDKDKLAVVNMNIAFGPSLAALTQDLVGDAGIQIVTHQVLDATPGKLEASVKAAVSEVSKSQPKAILVLAAGKPAFEFIRAMRAAPGGKTQLYGLSVLLHDVLAKEVGLEAVRGIVLSQAVPYPFVPSKPVITEFQADMRKYAPGEAISFSSLEGYLGAKIAAEAVRRTGSTPTRASLLQALSELGDHNLGGIHVSYTPSRRKGWGGVDLSIINASGSLQK
ncbi:MAG: ABC transporter substrate-binding protein [Hydrogenophaga sp.]|nr:ABC transporter substrate-binding protein [Hydrogenophaga sp.]